MLRKCQFFLLLFLIFSFKNSIQQECSYTTGIQLAGSDLLEKPLIVHTINQCCQFCLQQPNCQAWYGTLYFSRVNLSRFFIK